MNLTIKGHHVTVTDPMRDYVTTKLDRITRHFDQVENVIIVMSIEPHKEKTRRQQIVGKIHAKGQDFVGKTAHEDIYAAVDKLMDILDRQVVTAKDKAKKPSRGIAPGRIGNEVPPDQRCPTINRWLKSLPPPSSGTWGAVQMT